MHVVLEIYIIKINDKINNKTSITWFVFAISCFSLYSGLFQLVLFVCLAVGLLDVTLLFGFCLLAAGF